MSDKTVFKLLRIAIFFIIEFMSLAIIIEGSIGLIPYGLMLVGGITIVATAIVTLFRGTTKRLLLICKVLMFTGLLNLILFIVIVRIQKDFTKNNSELLINKIEIFKHDNGHYPNNLDSLLPNYIDKLPKMWIGITPKNFTYDYSEQLDHCFKNFKPINQIGEYHFWIGYNGYFGVDSYFNSKEKDWLLDD